MTYCNICEKHYCLECYKSVCKDCQNTNPILESCEFNCIEMMCGGIDDPDFDDCHMHCINDCPFSDLSIYECSNLNEKKKILYNL
jgi:hypothetical protein